MAQELDWKFGQVFGDKTAVEDVADGLFCFFVFVFLFCFWFFFWVLVGGKSFLECGLRFLGCTFPFFDVFSCLQWTSFLLLSSIKVVIS